MQKLKFLYLPDKKFRFIILLCFITFPIYTYELSEADKIYFQTITNNNFYNKEFIDNLTYSALNGSYAIRVQSALELSERALDLEEYEVVSSVCSSLLDEGFLNTALLEYLFESYYLQEDWDKFIFIVNKYLSKEYENLSQKIEYYNFISKLYDNHSSVSEYFKELLIRNKTSELILDAYARVKEMGIKLSPSLANLADFKTQLFKKEYYSANSTMIGILIQQKEYISDILNSGYIVDNEILTPVIMDEIYKTSRASGRRDDYLKILQEILLLPENLGFEPGEVYSYEFITGLYETIGYLKRAGGHFDEAAELFLRGLSYSSGKKYEKILWYWYNSLLRHSPETAFSHISLLTEKWTNPEYFTDVLSELLTYFVQQNQWDNIRNIQESIELSGPDESISKYAYLTARAGMESYIDMNQEEINRLMTLSYDSGFGIASGLYYRILAGNYLKIFDIRELPWMFNKTVKSILLPPSGGEKGSSELVFGHLEYENSINAYNYIMENPFSKFDLVRRTASELSKNNYFAKSIRLLNKYSQIDGFNLNISDLKLIYPDAYSNEILEISEKEDIEWYVFTALVREESHFQHEVVSSAGAVGLSQLMPATAADVAERLRVSKYNLRDAHTNLMFGGWYLGHLLNRTDLLSDALFAYNGGLTRVRRWREEYSWLSDDLFLEAIPYKETSHYGRKLLVSSVIYGYLYDGIQPDSIISLFYRN